MSTVAPARAAAATIDLLSELFRGVETPNFVVRLWDGTVWMPEGARDPAFILVVRHPGALRDVLRAGNEAALAEAYLADDLDIEGDIFAVPAVGRAILDRPRGAAGRARLALRMRKLPRTERIPPPTVPATETVGLGRRLRAAELRGRLHSLERDRAAVTHHYDLSNRFYSLFLDPLMVYSCAAFRSPDEALEPAQLRKLDLICRKLRIRAGDRLLDIGCGWGALIIHAAREHGARSLGVTLSERQAELTRERIHDAGLDDRCAVEVRDWRTLDAGGQFDRVASVGMFEHVGSARAPEYFEAVHRLLRPGGSYLHHAITANPLHRPAVGDTLSRRYVFPDHELISIGDTVRLAEKAGFDVRDVENLREHYALTLRRWIAALESNHAEAAAEVGEATWRAWHLVFAGAALEFEANGQGLAQILMIRDRDGGDAEIPLGRWDWYEGD